MRAKHRFFVDEPLSAGATTTLDGDRSSYICRVLRHRRGDRILCFDGSGVEHECEVLKATPDACVIAIGPLARQQERPRPQLAIGLPLLKGAPMDRALAQATELGAAQVWLLEAARSSVRLAAGRLRNKLAHWHKVLQASAEQCGTLYVPTLRSPLPVAELLEQADGEPVVFHPGGEAFPRALEPRDRVLLVGPEGGWAAAELDLFEQRGIPCYATGNLTLRAETAPGVALALVQQAQGWSY